jgi:hypothetical protein
MFPASGGAFKYMPFLALPEKYLESFAANRWDGGRKRNRQTVA